MRILTPLVAGAATALAAHAATAQSPTSYLCAGVGEESRAEADAMQHSLKIVFAEPDGHFLADVATVIEDGDGGVLVDVTCPGPWLLVDLPAGTYRIDASFHGETRTISVDVAGEQGQEQLVTF
ncbi:MAG: hypothetical protein R3F55_10620 [Alphaproteobacteria bacterium]